MAKEKILYEEVSGKNYSITNQKCRIYGLAFPVQSRPSGPSCACRIWCNHGYCTGHPGEDYPGTADTAPTCAQTSPPNCWDQLPLFGISWTRPSCNSHTVHHSHWSGRPCTVHRKLLSSRKRRDHPSEKSRWTWFVCDRHEEESTRLFPHFLQSDSH